MLASWAFTALFVMLIQAIFAKIVGSTVIEISPPSSSAP